MRSYSPPEATMNLELNDLNSSLLADFSDGLMRQPTSCASYGSHRKPGVYAVVYFRGRPQFLECSGGWYKGRARMSMSGNFGSDGSRSRGCSTSAKLALRPKTWIFGIGSSSSPDSARARTATGPGGTSGKLCGPQN